MKKIITACLFIVFSTITNAQSERAKEGAKKIAAINAAATTDSKDMAVYYVLESLYSELLQTDMGALSETTVDKFKGILINNRPNKNILEILMLYQDHVAGLDGLGPDTDFQLMATKVLMDECKRIHGKLPTVVSIYRGEAFMAAGMKAEAMETFKALLKEKPDCVPARVYIYQLTENPEERIKLGEALKRDKPKHWLVKETVE